MKIIFLGMPAPINDINEQDPKCHIAKVGSIAQLNLLKGIKRDTNNTLSIITTLPSGKRGVLDLGDGLKARVVPNWRTKSFGLFLLSLIPGNTVALFRELRGIKRAGHDERIMIISLNTTLPFSLPILLARQFHKNIVWCPFLVDSVEYPHYDSLSFRVANRFSAWAAKRADASITFNAPNSIDYIPNKPYLELFFSVSRADKELYSSNKSVKNKKFTLAYVGALTDIYSIKSIIQTIRNTGDKYRWVFAGYGPNQTVIEELAHDNRYDVEYLGVLSHDESIKLQKSTDLLLCLRLGGGSKVNDYSARYAASGKLSEYLCSGRPILAGDIPAFSEQFKQYMTCIKDQSAKNIQLEIENTIRNYDKKLKLAQQGKKFAFHVCDVDYQGTEINKFLRKLA